MRKLINYKVGILIVWLLWVYCGVATGQSRDDIGAQLDKLRERIGEVRATIEQCVDEVAKELFSQAEQAAKEAARRYPPASSVLFYNEALGFFQLLSVNGQSPQTNTHRFGNGIGHRRCHRGNAQLTDTADFVLALGNMHLDLGHLGHG